MDDDNDDDEEKCGVQSIVEIHGDSSVAKEAKLALVSVGPCCLSAHLHLSGLAGWRD